MATFFQAHLVALMVQAAGALLMAALCIALLRTMSRPALRYWSMGWVVLCISLQGLYLATYSQTFWMTGHVVYLLGEYTFGYMVYVGCRRYALGESPKRSKLWLLVPVTIWCIWLARFAGGDVNVLFAVHALVYPYLFFRSLRVLGGVTPGPHARIGLGVMKLALFLLTIDYLHYAPLRAAASYQGLTIFAQVPHLFAALRSDLSSHVDVRHGHDLDRPHAAGAGSGERGPQSRPRPAGRDVTDGSADVRAESARLLRRACGS